MRDSPPLLSKIYKIIYNKLTSILTEMLGKFHDLCQFHLFYSEYFRCFSMSICMVTDGFYYL